MMCSFKNAQGITRAVPRVWHGRYGTARCPAHDDRLLSLNKLVDFIKLCSRTSLRNSKTSRENRLYKKLKCQ